MSRRILAFVMTLILATLSACAARTDGLDGSEQHASTASALGVGPSSTPYPIKLVNGSPVAHWDGTLVDLMAADAWAQCGARIRSTAGVPSAELSTDGYLTYLEKKIDEASCPDTFTLNPPSPDFEIVNCTSSSSCPSKMKRWARQRQLKSCNVDASTGAAAVVAFHKNNEIGHYLASSLPASASPEFSGLLKPGVSSTILNQAVAAAQTEVDVAEVNLCMAQRLREHMASADSLFLSAADLRQLLEVIRERSQIAMMQYALLARTFTNPDNRSGGPSDPMQAFVTLMHWSTLSWAPLSDMGQDLAAAVQLHVDATRELAQLLVRSASARIDRAGAPTNNPQADFGSGSWRQRLLALLYGGNPLRAATTPGEIDPAGKSSEQVWAAIEAAESSVPWEAAWTEDPDKNWGFPNVFPAFVPAQRYGRTPTSDPRVKQLLALARKADALYLKELNGDLAHIGLYGSTGTLTFRRIDVEKTAPQVWALVEAWLRTEECKKVNPSCTVGVNDPAMPAEEAYAASLLWRRYGIQPAHAASLVSMLADVLPLLSEGEGQKWFQPSEPSVAYEQVGAMHVTGASHTLTPAQLAARLPGRDADEVWYRLAPDFNVVPFGNAERAPLYTAVGSLFVARSFDKWNVPRKQGFGQGTHIRHMGAISALSAARTLLEDSLAGANASIRGTYLAKVPRALEVIGGAIGEQSLRVQPSTELRYLYNLCREFDPASSTSRSCPTIVQTSSTNGETARWNVSLRTRADDPFFSGTVSLVIVPFQGGVETAAALDPSYSSPRSTLDYPVTRETLLLAKPPTQLVGRVDAPFVDTTPAGMSAKQREATIDLPVSTAIPSYHWLSHATFTVFLKRVDGGKTEYRLLAQQLGLKTSIQSRAIGSSTYALIGLPEEGQFIAYGGVLGDIATRAWATRAGDWSKPAYDGFGLPADWVPPFDPSLLGTGADDASATYLRHARAAADEATNAVKSAIDELLKEQSDEAAIKSAQRKAAGIARLEQRALCGDGKPDCDTRPYDFNMFSEGYITLPTCTGRLCLGALELISAKVVPRTVRLAQAVYDRRNDQAAPAFNDYAGGSLQSALIAQWAALNKLKRLMIETSAGLVSHERQVEAADAEYDHASGQAGYECSDEVFRKAVDAGMSFPGDMFVCSNCDTADAGDRTAWSPGPIIAQKQACERAQAAMPAANARYAAVVAQAWAWMASQMTVLLDAGSALQMASAEVAKALQVTTLAKAQAELEASLAFDNVVTKFGTYRRYHSYDVWRARGLLESTRRYAAAARRAIEARYVVDLSEMRSDEPFVAAPATWADEVYEYDLAAPASVGLTAIPTGGGGGGIYPNRLVDYVGNLERFVNGYAVARPTAIAQSDDEVFHVAGPDLRVGGVLSGDVAAWEFRCPDGSWVQHPGLDPETANAPIATVCGGPTPRRARVSFSLDPWGRLYGNIANPPYGRRHNARWRELAVNLVGTGLRDCAGAADPNSCYANAFVRYNLTHVGPAWVTDFDEQWRSLGVPAGSVEGAKGLAAEQWLDPTGNGFSKPYVANVARTEFAGRPIGGTYRLELEVTPDVRLDRLDRVQVLARSTYWVKQGKSDPPPAIATPPTLTSLDYDLADTAGGDSITITGTDLWNAIACTVGGTPATITSNTSTSLTFTMPPKSAGSHDVRVTTDEGTGNTLSIETWDPSLPAGCSVLLDGQLGRTDDGTGKLLSWAPRFGGNGNVTPYGGNAAKRPVNGVPLAFDGYDDSLYVAGGVLGGSTEQSTFFIARTTSANTIARSGYSVPEPVISSSYLGALGFSGPNVAIYPTAYMGVTTFSAAYPLNDGRPHLVGWAQEKPASDLITTVYADSQALGERVISSGVYYNSWGTLGEGYDSGGGPSVTDYFHGDLYAVISYARKLTTEERTKLYKWSRARYHVD